MKKHRFLAGMTALALGMGMAVAVPVRPMRAEAVSIQPVGSEVLAQAAYPFRVTSNYACDQLNADCKAYYDALLKTCTEIDNSSAFYASTPNISYPSNLTRDNVIEVTTLFFYNHPEFFWLSTNYNIASGWTSGVSLMIYSQFQNGEARQKAKSDYIAKINSYVNGAKQYSTDYERAEYLYKAMQRDVSYSSNDYEWSAWSAIMTGKATNAAYAKAYGLLCNAAGVETTVVSGPAHSWDLVKIAGKWYYVDVICELFIKGQSDINSYDSTIPPYTYSVDTGAPAVEYLMHDTPKHFNIINSLYPVPSSAYDGSKATVYDEVIVDPDPTEPETTVPSSASYEPKVEVVQLPTKIYYNVGDILELAGLKVTVSHNVNGTYQTVYENDTVAGHSGRYSVTGFVSTTPGEVPVTVTYKVFNDALGVWESGTAEFIVYVVGEDSTTAEATTTETTTTTTTTTETTTTETTTTTTTTTTPETTTTTTTTTATTPPEIPMTTSTSTTTTTTTTSTTTTTTTETTTTTTTPEPMTDPPQPTTSTTVTTPPEIPMTTSTTTTTTTEATTTTTETTTTAPAITTPADPNQTYTVYRVESKTVYYYSDDTTNFEQNKWNLFNNLISAMYQDTYQNGQLVEHKQVWDFWRITFDSSLTPQRLYEQSGRTCYHGGIKATIDGQEIYVGDVWVAKAGDIDFNGMTNASDAAKVLMYAAAKGAGNAATIHGDQSRDDFATYLACFRGGTGLGANTAAHILMLAAEEGAGN